MIKQLLLSFQQTRCRFWTAHPLQFLYEGPGSKGGPSWLPAASAAVAGGGVHALPHRVQQSHRLLPQPQGLLPRHRPGPGSPVHNGPVHSVSGWQDHSRSRPRAN